MDIRSWLTRAGAAVGHEKRLSVLIGFDGGGVDEALAEVDGLCPCGEPASADSVEEEVQSPGVGVWQGTVDDIALGAGAAIIGHSPAMPPRDPI